MGNGRHHRHHLHDHHHHCHHLFQVHDWPNLSLLQQKHKHHVQVSFSIFVLSLNPQRQHPILWWTNTPIMSIHPIGLRRAKIDAPGGISNPKSMHIGINYPWLSHTKITAPRGIGRPKSMHQNWIRCIVFLDFRDFLALGALIFWMH